MPREEIPSFATYPSRPSFDCRMSRYCHLLSSSRTALHSGALKGGKNVTKSWISTLVTQTVCVKTTHCRNSRMLALSLDMAATASSCVANSTSASPVTLPSGPISMWTRTGFSGEKNCKKRFTKAYVWHAQLGESDIIKFFLPSYVVDVRLCCSVRQTSHMDTVACCTLERGTTIAVPPIWTNAEISKFIGPTGKTSYSYLFYSLCIKGMYKGCPILPKMSTITGTHLRHILRGAFCHRILLGPSCCSPCHQMDGRKGQVSACPWASSVARNGSALQHGYSWRSQCTWEHTYAAVSTLGNGIKETESV